MRAELTFGANYIDARMNVKVKIVYSYIKNVGIYLDSVNAFAIILATLLRGRAEAARRAHNPEVASSNLAPATESAPLSAFFLPEIP